MEGDRAPLVSVIMPAYNHERFVGEAIESVLKQTVADLELVIIEDGSADATADVIRSYRDPRIVSRYQSNQDAFNALNRGLRLGRGRYLSIISSDDVYEPDRLEVLLDTARTSGAECLFTGVQPIDEAGRPIGDAAHPWNLWYAGARSHFAAAPSLFHGFLKRNVMVTTSNLFMSRAVFEATGLFAPLRFLHDYDYIFRILLGFEGRTVFLADRALVRYRLHAGNTLRGAAVSGRLEDQAVIRQYLYARVLPELHTYLDVGIDRLLELAAELRDVRASLAEAAR